VRGVGQAGQGEGRRSPEARLEDRGAEGRERVDEAPAPLGGNTRTSVAAAILLISTVASAADPPRALPTHEVEFKADLDGLIQRRLIRVAAPYSRTLYYNDKGRERGTSADFVRDFEAWINRTYAKRLGNRPITVVLRPTTRDQLLTSVAEGYADIAVGNLTITPERQKTLDFIPAGGMPPVAEIVVTGPKSPRIDSLDDLSGKLVHVRKTSSYYESLLALNERFDKADKQHMLLGLVPDALEDEDLMEMVNAGLVRIIVVDDWKARIWKQALPKIKLNEGAVLRKGATIGWGVRKNNPRLAEAVKDFQASFVKKQSLYAQRLKASFARVGQLNDPDAARDRKRFEDTIALFRKYGERYGFDPLMLAAMGYQESQLDQNARSHVGAIGIMQLMPATGTSLKVGDIRIAENNVHAGAKYMDELMVKHLTDAHFDEVNRSLFAFACYNAGPGNIGRMRDEARKRGLDPDKWFNNVELVTAEKLGLQTPTYVRNIYKYYVAYKLMTEVEAEQVKAREQVRKGKR
jgi:membrane-bound lytic murein transglycosylase MltF